ncbi:MAG: hypothetical protein COT22_03960 [Ignavibacteria bacterium CG08_land_8_20_14_0_20_37_9]|nr:hypothetical protein [Ignavibacteria bacterium]PIS45688.1 MAG: hypothetical protein COT22_03960 [Ignavibacteria bacterium CG08_land_8_20_14_0_20_37_9]PIX94714.1 MAG: hypothetical protein COZ25_04155 [Ignavibacteria bacterium CG_4_10_14_3_um_filter_37_18]PJC57651.1 MAG: hypothetical protein CO025_12270 [Ignavibacteria bacterium CG_4_9_14_0_2_um_filter_37_13]
MYKPAALIKDLSFNKEKTFWFLQISGWTLFYFQHVFVFSGIVDFTVNSLLNKTITWAIGFVISIFLRFSLRKIDFLKYSFISLSIIIFVSSFVCSIIWEGASLLTFEFIQSLKIELKDITFWTVVVGVFRNNVVFIGWSGLYFGIKFWMEWVLQKEKTDNALTLAHNAEYEMLRYQLNPHFLFNTLSSLRALTSEENVKAKEIITKISEFLRYTLITSGNNEVPLKNEIEVVKNYLDIEKVRFEEELLVEFDIDPAAEMCLIPIFLIHPLVENAIKHGMQTSPIPLKIFITAKMIDNILYLCVTNTGSWINRTEKNSTGKGLENINKRLEIFSPVYHSFEVIKNTDSVQVKLSLKTRTNKF